MSDIKLFRLSDRAVAEITSDISELEKPLQTLFEKNLDRLLNIRLLASEYTITNGRIDTLGLDENHCPVIIEYKRYSGENIINQGLFYLDWLMDHQADFKLLVMNTIDRTTADSIDWAAPRLVCVASDFTRYDKHAIKQINRNIELICYRKFGGDLLMLNLLTTATISATPLSDNRQTKPAKEHNAILADAKGAHKARYESLRNFLLDLGEDIQEHHLKHYVAFKRIKNFACVKLQKQKETILIFVNIDPGSVKLIPGFSRDVTNIGHHSTGDLELTISSDEDLEKAKPHIEQSYRRA